MKITKIHSNVISLTAAFLVAAISPSYGQGTVLFQHSGATDPTNEGFSFNGASGVGPAIGDLGVDAWSIGGGIAYYTRGIASQEQSLITVNDWTLSITLRVVNSTGPNGSTFIRFATGTAEFGLGFGLGPNGDPLIRAYGNGVTYALVGGGPGYHNYQLKYHALSSMANLWVDGIERLNGIAAFGQSQQAVFEWGAGQSPDYATANWNRVSLTVIPEPSSLALCFSGGLLLLAYEFHRRPTR